MLLKDRNSHQAKDFDSKHNGSIHIYISRPTGGKELNDSWRFNFIMVNNCVNKLSTLLQKGIVYRARHIIIQLVYIILVHVCTHTG